MHYLTCLTEALSTATSNAAMLMGMEKTLGSIAPGYFADIIAVQGEPSADIHAVIDHVVVIIKGGKIVVDKRAARAM